METRNGGTGFSGKADAHLSLSDGTTQILPIDDTAALCREIAEREDAESLLLLAGTDGCSPVRIDATLLPGSITHLTINGHGSAWDIQFVRTEDIARLRSLHIEACKISGIASLVEASPDLQRFWLTETAVVDNGGHLPSSVWQPSLEEFRCCAVPMRSLPNGLANAANLKKLSCTKSGLEFLPAELSAFCGEELDFEFNKIQDVYELHPAVAKANLIQNRIARIPEWAIERGFYINLRGNPIVVTEYDTFAPEKGWGEKLPLLDLAMNLIRSVPPWIPRIKIGNYPSSYHSSYIQSQCLKVPFMADPQALSSTA